MRYIILACDSKKASKRILQSYFQSKYQIKTMKQKYLYLLGITLFCFLTWSFTTNNFYDSMAEDDIKKLIKKCYVHGAFNELNPDAMLEGFHPDFAIYSAKGEEISKYPIKTWAESVSKRKMSDDFDPAKNKWEHKFASVDVTGGSASVKIELHHEGEHVFTDYLSLLKFDNGWKIVAKVYHRHE